MKTQAKTEEYLTTSQAAKLSHVTRFTVANWAKSGILKVSYTAGGHRRIPKESFEEFVQTHCKAKPAHPKVHGHNKLADIIGKGFYDTGRLLGKLRYGSEKGHTVSR